MKTTYQIRLDITQENYLKYYRGEVSNVIATSTSGQSVRFPARVLREIVSHNGIHGLFEISTDENNRFLKIKKIQG